MFWQHLSTDSPDAATWRRRAFESGLCTLCVLLIVVAGIGQATHFCGLPLYGVTSSSAFRADSPSTSLCLTCLMTQSAAIAPLLIGLIALLRTRARLPIPVACSHSFQPIFYLYVRPPPAL
jgi:hypothetical protein